MDKSLKFFTILLLFFIPFFSFCQNMTIGELFLSYKVFRSQVIFNPDKRSSLEYLIKEPTKKSLFPTDKASVIIINSNNGVKYGMVKNLFPNVTSDYSFFLSKEDSIGKVFFFFIFPNNEEDFIFESNSVMLYFLMNDSIWSYIDYNHGKYIINKTHIRAVDSVLDICINDEEIEKVKMSSSLTIDEFINSFREINYNNSIRVNWSTKINLHEIIKKRIKIYRAKPYKFSRRDLKYTNKFFQELNERSLNE